MKKIFTLCLTLCCAIGLFAQTYKNGQWYSYYDGGSHELKTEISSFNGVSYEADGFFAPLAGTLSFNWTYQSVGWGGLLANNNTTIYSSTNGGESTTKVGELTDKTWDISQSFSGNINTKTNWLKWDRPAGNTHNVIISNIAIPLAKHILYADNGEGNKKDKSNDFGSLTWGEVSEPFAVELRSFYTNGDITVTSSLPTVFRIGSADNTNGLTYAVGANACASKNGKAGQEAGGNKLGNISLYNFDIYFCPQEGIEYEGVVTITDGTNTLKVNVQGVGLKKDQTIAWDQEEGTFLSNIDLTEATTTSGLNIAYTYSEDGIVSDNEGQLVINGLGTVTITAAQAGDTRYNAAQSISKTFTINPAVTYGTFQTTVCQGTTFLFEADNNEYAAGEHQVNIKNVYGGDSIITLTINEFPVYNITDGATVCDNELPYIWDGRELTEAGEYTYTYKTVNDCDSTVTFTLTVYPTYNTTDGATVCPSAMPYNWDGRELTEAGEYTHTYKTVNGCDSIVTFTLTVNEAYQTTDGATICASELPYIWDGRELTEAGEHIYTYRSANGCDSTVTFTLTLKETSTYTDRITVCENALPFQWNGMEITSAEDNGKQFTTTNAVDCDSVVTLELIVLPVAHGEETLVLCDNELPYIWNDIELTGAEQDGTTITVTAANSCDSIVTLNLTILPTYTIQEQMTIYVGEEREWQGQDLSAFEVGYRELYAEYSTMAGCDSLYTLALNIVERPTTTYNYEASICEGSFYTDDNFTEELTEADVYTRTLTNTLGGDSIITLTLTVLPVQTTALTRTLTYGDDEWQEEFAGQNADVYEQTETLVSTLGCDSIVTTTITIAKAAQEIVWNMKDATLTVGETLTLDATATSGLEVTYTLSDETLATIEENVLTAIAAGELQLTVSQEGDNNYEAAEEMVITLTVLPQTGLREIMNEGNNTVRKALINGHLYIITDKAIYNAEGRKVE